MKRIIALLLVVVMAVSVIACGKKNPDETTDMNNTTTSNSTTSTTSTTTKITTPIVSDGFDEKNIVLQFGAVSDIHTGSNANKVSHAMQVLKDTAALYTSKGIDAVMVAGDLTNNYGSDESIKANEILEVKSAYEKVFDPAKVPMIFTLGNHDHDFERNGGAGSSLATFQNVLGNKKAYNQYDVATSDAANGSRHVVINGYHFLMVEPITYSCVEGDASGAKYRDATKKWLDDELSKITSENPNQYVFIITHPMIYGTVYGSDLLINTLYWYTKDLTSTLEKYPQVVTFGGHLHFPLQDERSIMQDKFTSLGCGSVQYMAIEDGSYENMSSATVMNDAYSISSGYLVQIDASGNVRFIRIDFSHDEIIKEPFVISTPASDGSHLLKYTNARGNSTNNTAPKFPADAITIEDTSSSGADVFNTVIKFKAAEDDDLVHHYVVKITLANSIFGRYNILTDFYRHPFTADMEKEYTLDLGNGFSRGSKYVITVTAYDSWGASDVVTYNYEPVLDLDNVKLPEPYADLDFTGGTIKDSKNKLAIENVGATIADTAVKFAGVTKTVPAFNVTEKGQFARLTFSEFTSSSSFTSLLRKDFSMEILYVNRSKTGTVGVIGGYDKYGFGFYEEEGNPAFKISLRGAFPTSMPEEKTSSDELVHVVAVYSKSSARLIVYVNGVPTVEQVSGVFRAKDGNYNVMCLGANSTDNGESDFATDLTVVDFKVYDVGITQAQATVLYNKAVESFKN